MGDDFIPSMLTMMILGVLVGIEIGRWRERGEFWLLRTAQRLSKSLGVAQ